VIGFKKSIELARLGVFLSAKTSAFNVINLVPFELGCIVVSN
jgi:hypothetical protein